MTVAALIWLLVSVDATLVGFRDAAGRVAMIAKRKIYATALFRGAIAGQLVCLASATVIFGSLALAEDRAGAWNAHLAAARLMAMVYVPYAVLVLSALVVYAVPNPDVSSLATVLVLGPFTAARPLVIVAGAAYAIGRRGVGAETVSLLFAVTAMLLLGPIFDRLYRRRRCYSGRRTRK